MAERRNVATIDALHAANSGGVTIAAGKTNTTSVKGGSGNDTITLTAAMADYQCNWSMVVLHTALVINAATDLDTVADSCKNAAITLCKHFKLLILLIIHCSGTTLNVTATGGATSFTNMTFDQAANITISGFNAAGKYRLVLLVH